MELSKKQNEIKVLAKYLRRSIENVTDLKLAVNELFKGEAELSVDNDEQFVIYTGQTFDRNYKTRDSVHSISSHEFLDADQ